MNKSELRDLIKECLTEVVSPFYETLAQTLDAVEAFMEKNQIVLDPQEHPEGVREPFQYGGIPYETTKDAHYKIVSMKGKPTRKYLHLSIYRMPTGRYELTQYVG
jgi:hypothetical protein